MGRTLLLLDTPEHTSLRGDTSRREKTPQIPALPPPTDNHVGLTIDWLNREAVTDFQRSRHPATGIVRNTCRIGSAKITRTVLVDTDGTVFIHLLASLPGALSFRVSLGVTGGGEARIEDRRELVLTTADGISAHVWVIPFEADVAPDGNSIIVRGEGEALILLSYAAGPEAAKSLAMTWKTLGDRHDPGNDTPDPTRVWREVLRQTRESIENSP